MKLKLGLAIGIWLLAGAAAAAPVEPPPVELNLATPPRLSFVDGQVSFWRPGAADWAQAQLNTALAAGDQLYTGSPGNVELQIGGRAFVRGWANSQIGLENLEPDFIQFKVTAGHVSFDLRALDPGRTLEVDTPQAAFMIDHEGYYRLDVDAQHTSFVTRRGGQAAATPGSGEAFSIAPSEEVVIQGPQSAQISSYAAPPLDSWDKWNYARTEHLLDSVSARYVSPGVYGVDDLDQSGTWRNVPEYGPVWVPTAVPAGWAPYSTGSWVMDPYYGWTWVDTAPWGWAPYHYGRWVYVNGFWGWAPGPPVARPVYAPALVAFFGGAGSGTGVGWVALGWGEPCVPWWGPAGFVHRPWWGGWGGPRVVNNVVVNRTTVVNVDNIHEYHNARVRNGLVAVRPDRFGHGPVGPARVSQVQADKFHPLHEAPRVGAAPANYVPAERRGVRPPTASLNRPVVSTRPPYAESGAHTARGSNEGPAPRLVSAPPVQRTTGPLPRASFGHSGVERSAADRARPPAPPRAVYSNSGARRLTAPPPQAKKLPIQPQGQANLAGPTLKPQPPPRQRVEHPKATQERTLPGEPASRMAPQLRGEKEQRPSGQRTTMEAGGRRSFEESARGQRVE